LARLRDPDASLHELSAHLCLVCTSLPFVLYAHGVQQRFHCLGPAAFALA
jgi:hypothetical protein